MSQALRSMLVEFPDAPVLDWLVEHPEEIGVLEEAIASHEAAMQYMNDCARRNPDCIDGVMMEEFKLEQRLRTELVKVKREWAKVHGG